MFTEFNSIAGGKRVIDETRNSAVSVKRLMSEMHITLFSEEGLGNANLTRSTLILVSFENTEHELLSKVTGYPLIQIHTHM